MAEYAERDILKQGEHYTRHVAAMTAEGLHDKSDIAAELAHRDIEIERYREPLEAISRALRMGFASHEILSEGSAIRDGVRAALMQPNA